MWTSPKNLSVERFCDSRRAGYVFAVWSERSALPPLVRLIGLEQSDLNLVSKAVNLAEDIAPRFGCLDG